MNDITGDGKGITGGPRLDPGEKLLAYFKYDHLPERLQVTSSRFYRIAYDLMSELPPSAERTTALRKLLEAKDCAVRAALDIPEPT